MRAHPGKVVRILTPTGHRRISQPGEEVAEQNLVAGPRQSATTASSGGDPDLAVHEARS